MLNKNYRLFVLDSDEYDRICRLVTLLSTAISDVIVAAEVPAADDPPWGSADDLRMEALDIKDIRSRREKSPNDQTHII